MICPGCGFKNDLLNTDPEMACAKCGKRFDPLHVSIIASLEDQIGNFDPQLVARVLQLATDEIGRLEHKVNEALARHLSGTKLDFDLEDQGIAGEIAFEDGCLIFRVTKGNGAPLTVGFPIDVKMFLTDTFRDMIKSSKYHDPKHPTTFVFSNGVKEQRRCYYSVANYIGGLRAEIDSKVFDDFRTLLIEKARSLQPAA